ncbi:MAG TPA: competence/damage-inducible protein A [candidate division Zixibacteria bacterium]|nr:competence/damage-inducible protein A [candidate division Zixibacteria bacterium]
MDIEILTIGDELLTGHTIDSNASYMAERLLQIGLKVKYMSSTGDSLKQMEEAFRLALNRAQIVITTGGLGPTDDDNTKKAIVKVFKRNLIFHEEVLEDLKKRYAVRNMEMPAINQNQALLPQGAKFFPNKHGSAVGLCISENGRTFISLPGVPQEMKQIIDDEVIPFLQNMSSSETITVLKLRTIGIGESKLSEFITPKLKLESGVKLAYLPSYSGVDLRIVSTAKTKEESESRAFELKRYLESVVGRYVYGKDFDKLEEIVGQLLKDNDKTLATAESCTGGYLGSIITSIPGSSAWFIGSIVSYANSVKINQLHVDKNIIEQHGAVSQECAEAMADGCRKQLDADFALSITGIAGPDGGTDEKPVGTTFIGLSSMHGTYAQKFNFGTNRNANRIRASYSALELLRRDILDIK